MGGVMVTVLVWSAVVRGFEHQSGQAKDYYWYFCFSSKQAALTSKSKDWWSARNKNNMCKWSDVSTRGLLF